jgi:hypothetical protein
VLSEGILNLHSFPGQWKVILIREKKKWYNVDACVVQDGVVRRSNAEWRLIT